MAEQITFNHDTFQSLLRHRRNATETIAETRGEYGGAVKEFIEGHGVNKIAFGMIARLSAMSPEKALDVLRSFDALRPELEAWHGKQNDWIDALDDENKAADGETSNDADPLDETGPLDEEEDERPYPRSAA